VFTGEIEYEQITNIYLNIYDWDLKTLLAHSFEFSQGKQIVFNTGYVRTFSNLKFNLTQISYGLEL